MTPEALALLARELAPLIAAELAPLLRPEPASADRRELARVMAGAWRFFRNEAWTISALTDVGIVDALDTRSVGRLLSRCAGQCVADLQLIDAGTHRGALRWRLRVTRLETPSRPDDDGA